MKKILFAFTLLLAIGACSNKPVTPVENNEESSEVVDKQYENKRVVLLNERETTYLPAIDRYLTDSIGSQYAKGEHCVPIHSIVRVDERKTLSSYLCSEEKRN